MARKTFINRKDVSKETKAKIHNSEFTYTGISTFLTENWILLKTHKSINRACDIRFSRKTMKMTKMHKVVDLEKQELENN